MLHLNTRSHICGGCPRWLCLCPMWVLGTYSLTPETAHSPQDTLRTQCSQYPYMLHTCRSVANARVSTFTLCMDCLQSMHTHTCAHTQTHTTYTLESRLYRHCGYCHISTVLYPQPIWIAEGEICLSSAALQSTWSWLFTMIMASRRKVDRLREKPKHAVLWGPSKKLDHLTEISSLLYSGVK